MKFAYKFVVASRLKTYFWKFYPIHTIWSISTWGFDATEG